MIRGRWALASALFVASQSVSATEIVSYQYDAKGRLIKVVKSGTVNSGVTTTYEHDQADNRKRVKTTGAP